MNKKKIPTDGILNELEGASLFFSPKSSNSSPSVALPQSEIQDIKRKDSSPIGNRISFPMERKPIKSDFRLPSPDVETISIQTNPSQKQLIRMPETNKEPKNERTNEQTFVRNNERFNKRAKIRHTFDIFADQLLSLREISIKEEKITGERVLLGDLAQRAFDLFIKEQCDNDRSNERTDD